MRKIDHHHCSGVPCDICGPDPRDAEIAALKAEVERVTRELERREICTQAAERQCDHATAIAREAEADLARHKRALAAGPAALRKRADEAADIGAYLDAAFDRKSADLVKAAQEAAMKEEP